jgi:hypothetical protein
MKIKKEAIKLLKHETKRNVLLRFLFVLLIFLGYFSFVSFKYGLDMGLLVTFLTWSFFVFCTPIADAGFLFDFPIRLITKIKMIYSEIFVWLIAILINIYSFLKNPEIYQITHLLKLFQHILENPFPYWGIIFISVMGTFLSVYFGDELMDVVKHIHRKKFHKHKTKRTKILIIFIIFVISILLYSYLIHVLNVNFN